MRVSKSTDILRFTDNQKTTFEMEIIIKPLQNHYKNEKYKI